MDESGGHPEWTFFLIGPNDFKVVDTWFTGAMRATGSNTAICDVFDMARLAILAIMPPVMSKQQHFV